MSKVVKSLQRIQDEVAVEVGYKSFDEMMTLLGSGTLAEARHSQVFYVYDKAAELFWKQKLPSEHQIGDGVWLTFWSHTHPTEIHGVHFSEGKVLYDLISSTRDGGSMRLYRIDPKNLCVVHPDHKPE